MFREIRSLILHLLLLAVVVAKETFLQNQSIQRAGFRFQTTPIFPRLRIWWVNRSSPTLSLICLVLSVETHETWTNLWFLLRALNQTQTLVTIKGARPGSECYPSPNLRKDISHIGVVDRMSLISNAYSVSCSLFYFFY